MKCLGTGDQVHADILLNIIFTILKFNGQEKKVLSDKKKSWWGLY